MGDGKELKKGGQGYRVLLGNGNLKLGILCRIAIP